MMLEVKNLSIFFTDNQESQEVAHEVSFAVRQGEIVGLVGESGSGKTITALTIAGLRKKDQVIKEGQIFLDGVDLLGLDSAKMRKVQGKEIGFIFQEPMSALNPTMKIGHQVEEALRIHTSLGKKERKERVIQALHDVELDEAEALYDKYPHELSGGMRQRVMIAAAMICRPKLLIADEPTTALDVGTQAAILQLLKKLNEKHGMSILFISHNLRVVKELCGWIAVMQHGEIIEQGKADDIFGNPQKEYTKALLAAIPPTVEESLREMIFPSISSFSQIE